MKIVDVSPDPLNDVFKYYDVRYKHQNAETDYYETKEYQVLHSLCNNELAHERVLYYFWYDINRDGKKELWVMLEFSSGDWMYTLFNIDKRRY